MTKIYTTFTSNILFISLSYSASSAAFCCTCENVVFVFLEAVSTIFSSKLRNTQNDSWCLRLCNYYTITFMHICI